MPILETVHLSFVDNFLENDKGSTSNYVAVLSLQMSMQCRTHLSLGLEQWLMSRGAIVIGCNSCLLYIILRTGFLNMASPNR